jgi:hypothetical protein
VSNPFAPQVAPTTGTSPLSSFAQGFAQGAGAGGTKRRKAKRRTSKDAPSAGAKQPTTKAAPQSAAFTGTLSTLRNPY